MLPTWALNAIAIAVTVAICTGAGFYGGLRWDDGVIQKMKAADAVAATKAQVQARTIEQQQTQISQANGAAEAAAQQVLQTKATTIIKEVPHYVTVAQDAHGCVTWGMLRVHDAAALGVDPASLLPPAGQSDDACSAVKPSDFAAAVAGNYATAAENAKQLDDLEADIAQRVADFDAGLTPKKKSISIPLP